jgi:hypothetical protein
MWLLLSQTILDAFLHYINSSGLLSFRERELKTLVLYFQKFYDH